MGWCSATDIFDSMAYHVIVESAVAEDSKYQILLTLAKSLEEDDWDCQSDSVWYDDPLVQKVFKELHPDWEWDDEVVPQIVTFKQLAQEYKKIGRLHELEHEMVKLFDDAWNDATSPVRLDQLYNTKLVEEGDEGWDWFVIEDDDELAEKVAGVVKKAAND